MVSRNPRVQVTLSDDAYAAVARLAELGGQGKAAVISELVDTALPTLRGMVAALEVYQAAEASVQAQMAAQLEAHADRLIPDVSRLADQHVEALNSLSETSA